MAGAAGFLMNMDVYWMHIVLFYSLVIHRISVHNLIFMLGPPEGSFGWFHRCWVSGLKNITLQAANYFALERVESEKLI